MNSTIQQSRLACISLLCLIGAWLLLWVFIKSGANSHPGSWWVQAGSFASILSAPLAALLAIAGLIFDRSKKLALIALVLGALSTLVVLSIGG